MSKSTPAPTVTRRNFALSAAAAATAVLLPATEGYSQSPSPGQAEAEAMAKLSPGARAEVQSKVAEIFRKYGSRLNDEQKADIRKVMAETQDGLEKMRSFALTNSDQPSAVFKLYEAGKTEPHA